MSLGLAKYTLISIVGLAGSTSAWAFDDIYGDDVPTFITPANMTSSYKDTPNSITSLEIADLDLLGIDNFVDAMRLVPGMIVADTHGSNATIGYHGTSVHVPRRMQILYNSNRLSRAGYAELLWQRMPIDLHDLERIEIVRGTNITDFGTNAFTSTVNMIQKPVALETGANVYLKSSTNGEKRALASANGNLGQSKGYLRFAAVSGEGFDESPQIKTFDDDYKGRSLLYNGELELGPSLLLDWYIAGSDYEYEFPAYDNITSEEEEVQATVGGFSGIGPTDERTFSGNVKLSGTATTGASREDWKAGLDVTTFERDQDLLFCYPVVFYDPVLAELDAAENIRIDVGELGLLLGSSLMTGVGALDKSVLAPLTDNQQQLLVRFGQTVQSAGLAAVTAATCGVTDQDLKEERYSAFASYSRTAAKLTFSSDLFLRRDDVTSATYMGGRHQRTSYELSNNLRYRVSDSTIFNLGVMSETNTDIGKAYFSPRASLNISLTPSNIIRVLGAYSNRLPSIHETERRWQYEVAFVDGGQDYYGRTQGKSFRLSTARELEPEKLEAYEIGYTYLSRSNQTVVDLKYFKEQYSDLISEPFSYFAFSLSNTGEADLEGFEAGFRHDFKTSRPFRLGGGLAYIDNSANNREERSLHSRLSGNGWAILGITDNVNLGVVYFGSHNQARNSYDRLDVNLSYDVNVRGSKVRLDANYRRMPEQQANYTEYSSTDPFLFGYNDRNIFSLKAEVAF